MVVISDLDIPQNDEEQRRSIDGVTSCNCVHPCDLSRFSTIEPEEANNPHSQKQQLTIVHDFFPAEEHCAQRQERCQKEKLRVASLSNGFLDPPAVSSSSGSLHRGFVDEQPNEFFNQLISERSFDFTTTTVSARSLDANELPSQQRKRKKRRRHDEINDDNRSVCTEPSFFLPLFTGLFYWLLINR